MNGAHWLWTGMGVISFDEVISSTCHAEYEDDDQFREALDTIAEVARTKALEIEARFASFDAIAKFVVERARAAPDREATGWWGYEAGIVSGLTSAWKDAGYFLQGVTDKRVRSYADELTPLIGNEKAFTKKVNDLVKQQRQALKLNPLPSEPF